MFLVQNSFDVCAAVLFIAITNFFFTSFSSATDMWKVLMQHQLVFSGLLTNNVVALQVQTHLVKIEEGYVYILHEHELSLCPYETDIDWWCAGALPCFAIKFYCKQFVFTCQLYTARLSDWRVSDSSPLAYLRERTCEFGIGAFLLCKDSEICFVRLAYRVAKAGE